MNKIIAFCTFLTFFLIVHIESTHSLEMQSEIEQGGLLREKTTPGSTIQFNGKNIRIKQDIEYTEEYCLSVIRK